MHRVGVDSTRDGEAARARTVRMTDIGDRGAGEHQGEKAGAERLE
jgi:hypothetical protein